MRSVVTILLLLLLTGLAAAEELLVQQEPFDQITLTDQYGSAVVKVKPLDLPGRERPRDPLPTNKLTAQLLDEPEKTYEVQWGAIAKIDLFEELVLAEAKRLVAAGRLDEAYDSFRFLQGNHPKVIGLAAAVEDYLFEEARASMRRRDYAGTLAMLGELFARNPQRPGLENALTLATEKAVEQHVTAGRHAAARRLWRQLGERFPGQAKAAAGEEQFKQQAAALLAKAQAAATQNDLAAATRLCRQVEELWPATPGARALAETLHAKWPVVAIGYVGPSGREVSTAWYTDWAFRRDSRLRDRPVCEFVGPAVGGGKYRCAAGDLVVDKAAPTVTIKLAAGQRTLDASDVVQQLYAALESASGRAAWETYGFASATPRTDTALTVTWSRPHFKPEAALTALSRGGGPSSTLFQPYRPVAGQVPGYELNPAYFGATATTPRQLTIKPFDSAAAAVRALRNGQISAIDRLGAADAARLAGDKRFVVSPYRIPLVHALALNVGKGLTAHRDFRRGLVYALDRGAALETVLAGRKADDCRLLSGPFPLGLGPDDPLRYAYDPKIEPRPFEPSLAVALLDAAARRLSPPAGKKPIRPRLVVAHPADAVARAACAEIAEQWRLVGLDVELRALAGTPATPPDDCDVLYVEYPVCEPLVDAEAILGERGLTGLCSPACGLLLRRVAEARDFEKAQAALHALHRLAQEEAALVPLWQWVEYWACRAELGAVGAPAVSLYDNVEQWRPAFTWSEQ